MMSYRDVISIFKILHLLLMVNIGFCQNSGPYDSENVIATHLCIKVTQGRFDQINIKSFTYYVRSNEKTLLIIFEGTKKYYIEPEAELIQNGTQLKLQPNHHEWDYDELRAPMASDELKGRITDTNKLNAVYYLWSGEHWHSKFPLFSFENGFWKAVVTGSGKVHWYMNKNMAFLITDAYIYVVDIWNWGSGIFANPHYIGSPARNYPDFAIIQYHTFIDPTRGYIIQHDQFDGTNDFIIFNLEINFSDGWFNVHKSEEANKDWVATAHFYYIELTKNPKDLLLVPRALRKKQSKSQAQLFTKQPKGFLYRDDVYLFDSQWGCVYLLRNFAKLNLEYNGTMKVSRINIPYERFFKCDHFGVADMSYLNASRCEKIWSDVAQDELYQAALARTSPPFWSWQSPTTAWSFFYLGLGLALFLVVAVGVYYYWFVYNPAKDTAANDGEQDGSIFKRFKELFKGKKSATPTGGSCGGTPINSNKGTPQGKAEKKKTKPKTKKTKPKTGEKDCKKEKKKTRERAQSKVATPKKKKSGKTSQSASSTGSGMNPSPSVAPTKDSAGQQPSSKKEFDFESESRSQRSSSTTGTGRTGESAKPSKPKDPKGGLGSDKSDPSTSTQQSGGFTPGEGNSKSE